MKKSLLITGAVLAALIVVVLILPFVIDINDHKGRIEELMEKEIRGRVALGSIRLSSWPYLGIGLQGLSVKNLPGSPFKGGEVLSLEKAAFKVSVKSLFAGKIIASLDLVQPKIRVVKSPEGLLNVQDLLPPSTAPKAPAPDLTENRWLHRILIEKIEILQGEVAYQDLSQAKGETLTLKPVNLKISKLQLTDAERPIRIEFDTAFKQVVLGFKTSVWLDLKGEKVRLGDGALLLGKGEIPFTLTANQIRHPEPHFEVTLDSTGLDLSGLLPPGTKIEGKPDLHLKASGTPRQVIASLRSHEIKSPPYVLTDLGLNLVYSGNQVTIKEAKVSLLDGTAIASGDLHLGVGGNYHLNLDVAHINISKATEMASGTAFLTLSANGQGLDQPSIQKNLQAKGEIKMVDGRLNSLNLAGSVLSQEVVGLMKTALAGRSDVVPLPGSEERGTPYKKLLIPFTVSEGRLIANDISLEQADYEGRMGGSIGLDQTVDLTGRLILPKEPTARMIPNAQVRPYVTDGEQRLVVPFKIVGTLKSPGVTPDGSYLRNLFANAAKKLVEGEAKKVIQEKVAPKVQDILKKLF